MIQTKIICTIGPVSESEEMLEAMHKAGMNVARINMSHGTYEAAEKVIKRIKRINKRSEQPIGILLDTKGPEIRTSNEEMEVFKGQTVHVHVPAEVNVQKGSIRIEYADLAKQLNVGDKIKLDNGLVNLLVKEKYSHTLTCEVLDGGPLKDKRHVNLPGIRVNLPAITEKDKADIAWGVKNDIDFIALSFVRDAADVRELRELLGENAHKIKIIAKIEDQEGLRNLEDITRAADGVMVARGDLGVEIDIEDLPNAQRLIVQTCARLGKRCVVATHMLESMIQNPIPTRAEVTDVSNAVHTEVDGIMLSGETTVGKHPIRCIEQLVNIARKTESTPGTGYAELLVKDSKRQHIASAAVTLAESLNSRAIVVLTASGTSADLVSNCKPHFAHVYAFTYVEKTFRTMLLNRGVQPFLIRYRPSADKALEDAMKTLKERRAIEPGSSVVIIADHMEGDTLVQSIQVRVMP